MKKTRLAGVVVAFALVAMIAVLAGCGGSSSASTSSGPSSYVQPADFKVADYAGKPLVINFFGSWCGPCNSEAPDLSAFAKAHPEAQFVGIAVNDTKAAVDDFFSKYGLTYPAVLDDNSLASQWTINGVPTTVFYDSAGKEVDRLVGAASPAQFEAGLAKAQ